MSQKSLSRKQRDLKDKLFELKTTDLFREMAQDDSLSAFPADVRARFLALQAQICPKRGDRQLEDGWRYCHQHDP